jgi:hypothetical protein
MRIRRLPVTDYDINNYDLDYYGYGYVDIFINEEQTIGERVNCIFRLKDLQKFNDDNCIDFTFAILCNNCYVKSGIEYLKGLNCGQIIPVQFEGEYNPTIPLEWILEKFWLL